MSWIDLFFWVLAILIGGGITWYFARYYFLKSPSKEDIQDLKDINKQSSESANILIQKKTEEIKNENVLNANVQLENLINSQFNRYLETKKLDRELLIKELEGNKIKTLYIIKQQEEAVEEKKLLTDRIKILGFKRVAYGDWILPPKKLKDKNFLNEKEGVKRWVEKNLLHGMKEHGFVNAVAIVDLSNIYNEQKGSPKKAKKIIGGVLKPADLISKDKLLSDIYKKEKISLKDIIQLPFLDVLINSDHPDISEEIKKNNSEIVREIACKLNVKNLIIPDLSSLNEKDLEEILKKKGIKSFKRSSQQILENARVLINYFNKSSKVVENLNCDLKQKEIHQNE